MGKKAKWIPLAIAGVSAACTLLHIYTKKRRETIFTVTFSLRSPDRETPPVSVETATAFITEELNKTKCPYGVYTIATPRGDITGNTLTYFIMTDNEEIVTALALAVTEALHIPPAIIKKNAHRGKKL